jgi:hypothetical protein
MQLPDFEIALSNVELKLESIKKQNLLKSDIIILYSHIKGGFIMLVYNPEQSQRGIDGSFTFLDLENLSIKNFSSN